MSTFGELLRTMPFPAKAEPSVTANLHFTGAAEERLAEVASPSASLRDGQIQLLVQQLFFRPEPDAVRRAVFAPIEASAQAASICFDVAKALASGDRHDVGLIDASLEGTTLAQQLQISSPAYAQPICPVLPRLWLVPRQSWIKESESQAVTAADLDRLRDLLGEFDFSVLHCGPVSWLTAQIARVCDGVVLVLTANKTRRLVAAQIKEQLAKARVPILGAVLAERRLPVPEGLYRKL